MVKSKKVSAFLNTIFKAFRIRKSKAKPSFVVDFKQDYSDFYGFKMVVLTDLHTMDPSLLVEEGEAFFKYVTADRKLLKESVAILDTLTQKILEIKPDVVLVSGDLTKDGEELSHKYLKKHSFEVLEKAGIRVLVVPGNHDINNPHAVKYLGAKTERVKTISPEEFAQIYSSNGYAEALARDEASLSYVYQLAPKLRLLALDPCKYDQNDFEKNICRHDGFVRKTTLAFINKQLLAAKLDGERVIAMMHHSLFEHWKHQNDMAPGYVVDNYKTLAKLFRRHGVEILFSGHAHSQDIVCEGGIYDIETGSPVSYPLPYRVAQMDDTHLIIESFFLEDVDYDFGDVSMQDYAYKSAVDGIKTHVLAVIPKMFPEDLRERAAALLSRNMVDSFRGEDSYTQEKFNEVKAMCKELRSYSFKWSLFYKKAAKATFDDSEIEDNDITIRFKK